jgi:signal transduction histidine kinase
MALIKEHELNELKSRFISMASHEFRTPLSAISTSAILIAKQNMPVKEEKRVKYVERIRSNVRNLVVILNDFLSLGKLEEGKVQSKPERVDLVEFTNNLIDEMKPNRKEGQKIKLVTQQVTVPVYLDPKLLKHIFTNLLSNAIKYSEKGDQILVKLKKGKEKVSLAVTDQGIGIPIEEQDNLFDRFFRAENSINIQGTGLGLHIVKQYTQLMGGKVSFKSEVGKGSTFLVEFKVP